MAKLDDKTHGKFVRPAFWWARPAAPPQPAAPPAAAAGQRLDYQTVPTAPTGPASAAAQASIEVLFEQTFQRIRGFGGAFTEAAATNFQKLPAAVQAKVMEAYYGETGLKYNLGRVHIGSCDFCLDSYNFDNVTGDYSLQHFDRSVRRDQGTVIPLIRLANQTAGGRLQVLGSPWSPPAWAKVARNVTVYSEHNGTTTETIEYNVKSMMGSAQPNGLIDTVDTKAFWARYLSAWLSAYQAQGVDIWAITVQNEPENNPPWDACVYQPEYMRDFVRDFLGPTLRQDHPGVDILGFDHNKDHIFTWAQTLLGDPAAAQYIDGLAFHWYGGSMNRLVDGTYGYYNLQRTAAAFPDKYLYASEGCSCPGVELGSWLRAERKAHDILADLNNHAVAWTDWNILLDADGGPNHVGNNCDAPIVCNEDFSDVVFQPEYFYQGHIMRYLQPGAARVYSDVRGHYQNNGGDSGAFVESDVTLYNCEASSRQNWKFGPNGKLALMDTMSWDLPLCVGGPKSFGDAALQMTNCFFGGGGHPYTWGGAQFEIDDQDRIKLVNGTYWSTPTLPVDENTDYCLTILDGSIEDAAALTLQECEQGDSPPLHQRWTVQDAENGGTLSSKLNGKCITSGWAFFQGAAFVNPDGTKVVVVLNEAGEDVPFTVADGPSRLGTTIPARSIQTYVIPQG